MVILGLGANLGDRHAMFLEALRRLGSQISIIKTSPIYETGAREVLDQPDFLNAAVLGRTTLQPHELLQFCRTMEKQLGRLTSEHFGPRQIDIDILYYNREIIDDGGLILPHPRRTGRRFVLKPLSDIAPDFVDPVTHQTVAEMLNDLDDIDDVRLFAKQWPVKVTGKTEGDEDNNHD
ncbi:MAG: 2-amino-4-hydroxy-6-hydroxymethyldihydropteridine diphosphokinase [Alphaproteobacteria bacterium]|nr:2-amino-4-hydroxy-6-hydroxymethyldihydropteridine diphosphokinase [Alphaproteobacteria bacterium]